MRTCPLPPDGYVTELSTQSTKLSGYFDAVVRLLGGFSDLPVLASRCAYGLIDALATKSTKKVAQRLRAALNLTRLTEDVIGERLRDAGVVLDLSSSRTADEMKTLESIRPFARDVLPTLTALTACGAVRRGLYLECSACGSPGWHAINLLGERVECMGCGERQPVPAEYPKGSGKEITWSYSLNSLVNRAWDQDLGPVLVTMSHILTGADEITCRGAGIEVMQDSEVVGDLDWIAYRNGRLIAGEAKSGAGLGSKDLNFARTMLNSGIDEFYLSTVSAFSEASREAISTLVTEFGDNPSRVFPLEGEQLLAS